MKDMEVVFTGVVPPPLAAATSSSECDEDTGDAAGEPWTHNIMPCAKQAIPLLERNEKIVSWIKPIGSSVSQHIPAILYKDKFFSLSLRMQKAIYRCSCLSAFVKDDDFL